MVGARCEVVVSRWQIGLQDYCEREESWAEKPAEEETRLEKLVEVDRHLVRPWVECNYLGEAAESTRPRFLVPVQTVT